MTGDVARAPRRIGVRWLVRQDWLFALALALFVGIVVWFGRSIQDFFTPSATALSTPAFVGLTYDDAVATANRDHLRIAVLQRVASDRFPSNVVMSQDPSAGALVRQGRQISVVVSTGVRIFPMPDLRYESLREVGLDLSRLRLVLGKVRSVQSDTVPANLVVSQEPAPLLSVREGATVNVDVSKSGPQSIRLPDFTNRDVDAVRSYASDNRLTLGQIVWTPFGRNGPARGTVVRQRPAAGTLLDPSQSVSIQVSAGPREAGYVVRQVHASVTVPQDAAESGDGSSSPTVRVQVRDETGTWNVFDAYAQPKQRLDFNLTTIGTSELDVFVNNELVDSARLGVEPKIQERQTVPPLPRVRATPASTTTKAAR